MHRAADPSYEYTTSVYYPDPSYEYTTSVYYPDTSYEYTTSVYYPDPSYEYTTSVYYPEPVTSRLRGERCYHLTTQPVERVRLGPVVDEIEGNLGIIQAVNI